mgnify:CR=1 FL=1
MSAPECLQLVCPMQCMCAVRQHQHALFGSRQTSPSSVCSLCAMPLAACVTQGMWELSINKQHHAELELRHLQPVVQHLQNPNVEVSRMCAATLWGLAVNEQSRALMLQLHAVEALLAVARFSLTMHCIGDSELLPGDYVAGGKCSQSQRNQLQVRRRRQHRAKPANEAAVGRSWV